MTIEKEVAIITGAGRGIGLATARRLLEDGFHVVMVDVSADPLTANAAELRSVGNSVEDHVLSVTDRAAVADLVASLPRLDVLVNAAGINTRQAADDVTPEGWEMTLGINLTAPFFLAQAFAPAMKEKRWGRIVNFASLQSYRAFPGGIAYGASKGAVVQMTRAMAEAWSGCGITANAIGPGFFRTELTAPVFADPARAARNAAQTCVGRNGEPEDIDGPVLFLCSDAGAYVTGQTLMVDGGFTAK